MDQENLTPEESLDLEEIMRLIDMPAPEQEKKTEEPKSAELTTQPEEPAVSERRTKERNSPQKNLVLYLHDLVYLIAGIVLLFLFCFRMVIVSGNSMYDTLRDGDYLLLISNVFYQDPKQGDIIVANKHSYENGTPIIKRIVATEGQTVDIDFDEGIVYVDGQPLEEDYIYTETDRNEGMEFPLTVDAGCVFVMGDNRARSKDSRDPEIGLIDQREIVGKAIFLLFPGYDRIEDGRDFGRIGAVQ